MARRQISKNESRRKTRCGAAKRTCPKRKESAILGALRGKSPAENSFGRKKIIEFLDTNQEPNQPRNSSTSEFTRKTLRWFSRLGSAPHRTERIGIIRFES